MSDFKPYEKEPTYRVELTKKEAQLIQKLRGIAYGSVTAHIVNKKLVRTETINSQMGDEDNSEITIAYEVISD